MENNPRSSWKIKSLVKKEIWGKTKEERADFKVAKDEFEFYEVSSKWTWWIQNGQGNFELINMSSKWKLMNSKFKEFLNSTTMKIGFMCSSFN